jgi:hypothetical protein
MTVGAHRGAAHLAIYGVGGSFILSDSDMELIPWKEIFFGLIGFVANDSAWLPKAPLDIDSLLAHAVTHYCANDPVVLYR